MRDIHSTSKYILAGLTSAFLFGAATPASKILLQGIQPQVLAGLLYLGAALGVLPIAVRDAAFQWPWRAGRRTILLLTGAIMTGGILGPLFLLIALKIAKAGSVSLWLNLEFVATVILGHFLFREHLTLRGWIAAVGTFIAALLLVGGKGGGGIIPIVLIILGCICWGLDNHLTALIDRISPAQTTMWKGFAAGTCNLFLGSVISGVAGLPNMVFVALLVGVLSYGYSITLYVTAAQGLGAVRSQMIFSTAPFFGLLISVTVLEETFTGGQAIAAGLMAASLIILFSEKHAHTHRHYQILHQHNHRHDELHHDHEHDELKSLENHSHHHKHRPREHSHKHWPDLHHRHDHKEN
jgi:drug/metabolite transporter (DMT)-like permease